MNQQSPHDDDRKTLAQIVELARYSSLPDAMDDAYHLGRIRGRLEGAEAVSEKLTALSR